MDISIRKQTLKKSIAVLMALLIALSSMWTGLGVISFASADVETGDCGDGVTYRWNKASGLVVISGNGIVNWNSIGSPFGSKSDIYTVVFSEGVTGVENEVFYDCPDLTDIFIPVSFRLLNETFDGCGNLQNVYYAGSADGWDALLMNSTYNLRFLDRVQVHYEQPYLSGNVTNGNVTDGNVSNGNITEDESPIYKISVGETKEIDVARNKITLLEFVPEVTGRYEFRADSDWDDTYGYLYDENMVIVASNDDSGEFLDFSITAFLYEGKTYYWGARLYDYSAGSFNVVLNLVEVYCPHESTEKTDGKEATCTEDGYTEGYRCLACGGWVSGHITIPAGHVDNDSDRACDNCGESAIIRSGNCGSLYDMIEYDDNAKYNLYFDGTLEIFGEGEIGDYVFGNWDEIRKVIIGEGITEIGREVFWSCDELASVEIPETVTSIGQEAFANCSELKTIELPESVKAIEAAAFLGCYNLSVLILNPYCEIGDNGYKTFGSDAVIWSHIGSEAQDYAIANSCTFLDIKHGSIKSVNYVPVRSFEFTDRISMALTLDDETWTEYYYYPVVSSEGDRIEVEFSDGAVVDFVTEDRGNYIEFTSEDNQQLEGVSLSSEQSITNTWGVGEHSATLECAGKSYAVPVTVRECPVESISADYKYTLYNGYDCNFYETYYYDSYGEEYGNLNDNDIECKVVYKDGTERTMTRTQLKEEYGVAAEYEISIEEEGLNKGIINLGAIRGDFIVDVVDGIPEGNLPESRSINFEWLMQGEPVSLQLLEFADKGYEHEVKALRVPEGLSIDKDGLLTGVTSCIAMKTITFEVRWKDSPAHEIHEVNLHFVNDSDKIELPDEAKEAEEIEFFKDISVKVPEGTVKWLKFIAPVETLSFRESDYDEVHRKLPNIYTEDGIRISSFDWGTGGVLYNVRYGSTYYIKVTRDIDFVLRGKRWMPEWTGTGTINSSELELVGANIEKTFEDDTNTSWNVYRLTGSVDIDFEGGFVYKYFGMMRRIASPVNIHDESKLLSCNQDVIYTDSYKYDPNNIEECEALGASTTQQTMKDELREGEKEYRFDNVYCLIPKTGTLELSEERLLYIPVGYIFDDGHVVKCTEHANVTETKENETEITCTEGGAYTKIVTCDDCKEVISKEVVIVSAKGHTAAESVKENEVAATCTADGSYDAVVYCSVCNAEISREAKVVTATGHTEVVDSAVAPTCTVTGLTEGKHCSACNEVLLAQETVAVLEHSWNEGVINPDSTCTTEGVKTYTCTVCGETKTEAVSAKGHTAAEAVKENEVAATCTADGSYDAVVYCSVCNAEISREAKVVTATGHTEVVDSAVAPTCTEAGLTEGKHCSVCNEVLVAQEAVAALGHTWDEGVVNPDSTCTSEGVKTFTCSDCEDTYTEVVSAKGHTAAESVKENEVAATCTADGSYDAVVYCSVCKAEISRETTVIPATGHTEVVDNAVAPTCTETGLTEGKHCSTCNEVLVAQETVAVLEHSWNEGVINPDSTCTAEGVKTYTCTVCEETRTEAVSAKGHTAAESVKENEVAATCTADGSYDAVVYCSVCNAEISREAKVVTATGHIEVVDSAVAPTCTATGLTEGKHCSVCNEVLVAQETVAALGHKNKTTTTKATLAANGKTETKCSVCGAVSKTIPIYMPKTFTLSATSYTYDGKVKTPSVTVKDSKGKTLKKDTDYTVSYEKGRKNPGEYTVTITLKGNYSGAKKINFTIKPKTVTGIKATQTTTSIKLTWSKVTGATGYVVYKYNTKTKKYEKVKDVKTNSLTISKLKAGTKYKYEVRAYTKDNGTIWGAYSKSFETATKPATLSLKVTSTAKGKATLTWKNISGESGYEVYYSTKKSSGFKKYSSPKVNATKATVSKLTSGKTYYFKVRAYTKTASGTVYGDYKTVAVRVK